MSKLIDRRVTEASEMRVDGGSDGTPPCIKGYAAVFNSMSLPMMGFRETIVPGAFKKTLREADVRALMNHDPNYVLGRSSAGTLTLAEDQKGLRYSIDPPDTNFARDLMVSIKRGDVTQSSFGFDVVRDRFTQENDVITRTLLEVRLYDVSPVTFPAYPQTEVSVRSLMDYLAMKTESGGEIDAEERAAVLTVLTRIKDLYRTEPATRHSGHRTETPGASESDLAHVREESGRALSMLRRRLELLLVG